jgi:hypothetical protein
MIDTTEQAFIETPTGRQVGFGFRRLGYDDKAIYIETEPDSFLLIEKSAGQPIGPLTLSELDARLRRLGSPASLLRSPESVYHSLRWTFWDLLVIPLVFGLPVLLAALVTYYVWKVRKGSIAQMA